MTRSIMPEKFYEKFRVNVEDELVLAVAIVINRQHTTLLQQTEIEVNALLSKTNDLKELSSADKQHLTKILAIQDVLRAENISEAQNPYGIYTTAQRLFYLNHKLILEIKQLKENNELDHQKKHDLLNLKYNELRVALIANSNNINKEILDIANRRAVIEQLYEAYESRGLLDNIKVDWLSQNHYYFALTTGAGEIVASATRVILLLTRHLGALYESLPVVAGTFALFSTLATLIVSGHQIATNKDSLEVHQTVNIVATITAGFLNVSSHVLDAIKALGPTAIAQQLVWAPFISTGASTLLLGVEIGNIVRAKVRYNQDIKLFNQQFTKGDGSSWLAVGTRLSQEDLDLKKALLNYSSVKEANKHPEAMRSLFTEEEFFDFVTPRLMQHAKKERNKLVIRHSINASILLTLIAAGIVAFCVPAFGVIIAASVITFIFIVFITKVILYNTILKEQPFTSIKELQARILQRDTKPLDMDEKESIAGIIASDFARDFDAGIQFGLGLNLEFNEEPVSVKSLVRPELIMFSSLSSEHLDALDSSLDENDLPAPQP